MRPSYRALLAVLVVTGVTAAQETYWVANRTSNNLSAIYPWGKTAATVATPTSLRRVVQAPDGNLWVVRFIQTTIDLLSPTGAPLTTIVNPTGNVYDVAFDTAGHAWVSGGTSLNEYSAVGTLLNSYPMPAAAPLGITIDNNGNKWIAHRTTPASVSRVDGTTAVVSNHPLPITSLLPTAVYADFRGIGIPSHVWVIGDGGGQLLELDPTGATVNTYASGLASISSLAQDPVSGDMFIGSFGNGGVARITLAGAPVGTFINSPSCLGLAFDSFGRLFVTTRLTSPILSEVRRYDITTNTMEVVTQVGLGTQSALSTRHQYALVVDPMGDADADAITNGAEILAGTSPWDPQSNAFTSLNTTGQSGGGGSILIGVQAPPTAATYIAVAGGFAPPGIIFGGISGTVVLDLSTLLYDPFTNSPFLFSTSGTVGIPIPIPTGLAGLSLTMQALTIDTFGMQFTNPSGLFIYN